MFKAHAAEMATEKQAGGWSGWFAFIGSIAVAGLFLFFVMLFSGAEAGDVSTQGDFVAQVMLPFAGLGLLSSLCFHASSIYRQRADDIRAQALNETVAEGSDRGPQHQPFVLYLRPFDSTNKVKVTVTDVHNDSRTYELETQLSKAARHFGQFVALGRSLEHVGAGRIETSDAEWQETALGLMAEASLIIIVPVTNPGTLWEIDQILENGWMPKTMVLCVPTRFTLFSSNTFDQSSGWPAVQDRFASAGYTLPRYARSGEAHFFGGRKIPLITDRLKLQSVGHLRGLMRDTKLLDRRPG